MSARQKNRAMERHDCFPGPGRTGDPRRTGVDPLHHLALRRVQKDSPLLPRIVERARQLLDIAHRTKAPQGIRMLERIGGGHRLDSLRRDTGGKVEQSLRRLGRQMVGQFQ